MVDPSRNLPREIVRGVPCPECGARSAEPCIGSRGQLRTANHQARVDAAISQNDRSVVTTNSVAPTAGPAEVAGTVFDDVVVVGSVIAAAPTSTWAALVVHDSSGRRIKIAGTGLKRYAVAGKTLAVSGTWRVHQAYGPQVAVSRATDDFVGPRAN